MTIPFPCECPFHTPEDDCFHDNSETGKCKGCRHSDPEYLSSDCPDPCQFPTNCPLEERPDDEIRNDEFIVSLMHNSHNDRSELKI